MNLSKLISTIKKSEMNLSQLHILSVLEDGKDYYFTQISDLTGCGETTCTKVSRELENLSLIKRSKGKAVGTNRVRLIKVKITRYGKALLKALRKSAGGVENGEGEKDNINKLVELCHSRSANAGWWSGDCNLPEKICLIHSELSEAMEGLRKNLMDDKLPHRKMEEVEMADAAIRIFDYCGFRRFDLDSAIKEKMEYNLKREDHKLENRSKKGGKKF